MGNQASIRSNKPLELTASDPSNTEYAIRFDSESFAEGKHRQCFIGTLDNENAPKHGKKVVLKVFKPAMVEQYDADYECVKDLEKSIICHDIGLKFNRAMKNKPVDAMTISFPAPLRLNIKRSEEFEANQADERQKLELAAFNNIPIQLKQHKYLTLELLLSGNEQHKHHKLSSNNGWMDTSSDYAFLSAFSHFSWAASKGKFLINGLQGIQLGHVLFLNSSVVHSDAIGAMGQTDLGIIGMINFFLNHECNECCKHLPTMNTTLLLQHLSTDSILEPQPVNTYLFELNAETMEKDQANLKDVYAASVQQTFIEKVIPKKIPSKRTEENAVVEEEDEDAEDELGGGSESAESECEFDAEMEKITHNMKMLWFADESINVYMSGSGSDADVEKENENEWELI